MSGPITDCPPSAPSADRRARALWVVLVDHVCRLAAAAVFLMAAVTKLTAPEEFRTLVMLRAGLPAEAGAAAAALLPWLELTCGFCLLTGLAAREAAAIGAALLVAFSAFLLALPADADCGCLLFPIAPPREALGWSLLARNLLLLLCCLRVAWRAGSDRYVTSPLSPPS